MRLIMSMLILTTILSAANCKSPPPATSISCEKIPVAPGPEDMTLDTYGTNPRLIVAAHNRRQWNEAGDIYSLDLKSHSVRKMSRLNEPKGLVLRPQDVDLVRSNSGRLILYVGIHDSTTEGKYHAIVKYEVKGPDLIFERLIESPMLTSPNGIHALPDESFYVSNDRVDRGSKLSVLLKLKKGNVLYFDKQGKFNVAATHLAYPNSMGMYNGKAYLSVTGENRIYRFDASDPGKLSHRDVFAEVTSPDNVWIAGDYLYTQSHYSTLDILRQLKSAKATAASVVLRINLKTRATEYVYVNDGKQFSAASSAFVYGNRLYMGQIFDPNVLSCKL